MLSDSCFFSPWWSLWLNRIFLSSFHGMISSFHGMIPSYHDMISSYHAVFGLRHRDKSAKVIGLSGQTRGKGIPLKTSFHRKRLRWRMQTFTMAGANVYDGGCKRLRWRMQTFTMAGANVYGKKHILLGNQILSGQYLFPEASYSSRERPWEKTALLPYLVWKSIMRAMAR